MSRTSLQTLVPQGGWNMPAHPRLSPLQDEELSLRKRLILAMMLKIGKARCPNIFRTLFRNFRIYFPFVKFNAKIMPKGQLSRRHTELAILRVGWQVRSYYEWGQHVEIGLRIGLTAEDIYRVTLGADATGWNPYESAILRCVDELLAQQAISAESWSTLTRYFDERLMIELMFVITSYNSLACMLNSVGVELEAEIEQVLAHTYYSH